MKETERKKAEEKIKESEERWNALTQNTSDYILIVDKDNTIRYINKTFPPQTPEQVIGKSVYDYVAKEHHDVMRRSVGKVFKTGKSENYEISLNIPEVGKIWMDIKVIPINSDEEIRGVIMINSDTTEKKKVEEKIKESEEKYKSLYEKSNDAIMTLEPPTWKFTSGNPATVKMFRTKDEGEFVSLGPWQLSPEKQPDGQLSSVKAKKMIMKAMKDGSNFFEWTHKRYNGEDFPATVLLSRMELKGKKFLQATVRDIAAIKKAEQKIKESEQRYREIFEGASDGILAADAKAKKFVFANPKICKITGYSEDELLNLGVADIHPKKDLPYVVDQFTKQVQGKLDVAKDIPILRKDKGIIYCDVNSKPIIINGKEVLLGFFRDLSDRKEMDMVLDISKQEVKESQQLYQSIINSMNDVVVTTDNKNKISSINAAGQRLLDYDHKKVMGKPAAMLFEGAEKLQEAMKSLEQENPNDFEVNLVAKNKEKVICILTIAKLKDRDNVLGNVLILHDIRNRKQVEESLQKSHEELQKKVNEMERFHKMAVDRELRMIELKKRIKELEGKVNK